MKKYKNKVLMIVFMLTLPYLSLADTSQPVDSSGKIINPISSTSIIDLIHKILEGVLKIGMPVIVLAIIYSGFLFVSAQGNAEELGTAKRSLMYTLIGAALLIGSWALAQLISETVLSL